MPSREYIRFVSSRTVRHSFWCAAFRRQWLWNTVRFFCCLILPPFFVKTPNGCIRQDLVSFQGSYGKHSPKAIHSIIGWVWQKYIFLPCLLRYETGKQRILPSFSLCLIPVLLSYSITDKHIDTVLLSKTRRFVSIHLSGVTFLCFWHRTYSNSVP